jgi:predicted Rossmann fold flavoprotein
MLFDGMNNSPTWFPQVHSLSFDLEPSSRVFHSLFLYHQLTHPITRSPLKHEFDVVILGAGAAGLMCAIEAGKRERRVALLDHAERIGKKILISGGGRCNFTNLHCKPENFLSSNPHFAKSALARYTPADFIALVQKHRIAYHEKTLGQLFCDGSSREIVTMLEEECRRYGVRIFLNSRISEITRDDRFTLRSSDHEFRAESLVVATGGLSIPKMGATPYGYEIARKFGLKIKETRPALVPFVFSEEDRQRYCDLSGISTDVIASAGKQHFREKMLITHRGLSGPAILQISTYWKPGTPVRLDLAPSKHPTAILRNNSGHRDLETARPIFRELLPHRFADRWLEFNAPKRWTNADLEQLENRTHAWDIIPERTEGYEKAEVTAGGVDTNELDAKTMQSRKVPGLYMIGEVVDVTGHLGGFNFQWAWASGFSAGQSP